MGHLFQRSNRGAIENLAAGLEARTMTRAIPARFSRIPIGVIHPAYCPAAFRFSSAKVTAARSLFRVGSYRVVHGLSRSKIKSLSSIPAYRMIERLRPKPKPCFAWIDVSPLFCSWKEGSKFVSSYRGSDPRAPQVGSHKSEIIRTPVTCAHLAAGAASKSVKLQRPARATVCSHSLKGRDRQCSRDCSPERR